ncbi:SRPBCC domain-containing protein [Gaiella sp.]|uniref:SRPBCC family protein n=1 Tax=Gaiella sp. TaxID=2663207 RepID=UPI003263687D
MSVANVHKDADTLTMAITAEFDAPVEEVWNVWADPRKLERWWGPPTYPATVLDHDLTPGGRVTYVMTGPEGDRHRGWWRVLAVEAPHRLEFEDGFADGAGDPNPDLPTTVARVSLSTPEDGRTTMAIETTFPTLGAMEQILAMGMEEGITLAIGQIDALLV